MLLTAFLVSAGLATFAGLGREPGIQIEIEAGYALPEPGDWGNLLANRGWSGRIDITARSARPCRSLRLAATQHPPGQYGEGADFVRLESAGSALRTEGSYLIYPGRPYRIEVTAHCRGGLGEGVRHTASAALRAGLRPCRGPVRILRSTSPAAPLGKELEPGDALELDRTIIVGAPECNGFHATLLPGSTRIGSYRAGGRGDAFSGRSVTVSRGDAHGGDFAVTGTSLVVRPRGISCAHCALPLPSAYAVRSQGTRSVVRVYSGAVDVTGATETVRLTAWHDGFFVCPSSRPCRLVAIRLVQPREPLVIEWRPRQRLRTVLPGAATPPAEALAPPRAETRVVRVAAAAGEPRELVVEWSRGTRRVGRNDHPRPQSGVFVWQRLNGAWRLVHRYGATYQEPYLRARVADVTGDGHRDVLVDRVTGGSAGCGTRSVFASIHGRIKQVFRRSFCEGGIVAGSGGLELQLPVGPCPYRAGGAHCFGGYATTVLRLAGERLVPVGRTVECSLPRLDPQRDCR